MTEKTSATSALFPQAAETVIDCGFCTGWGQSDTHAHILSVGHLVTGPKQLFKSSIATGTASSTRPFAQSLELIVACNEEGRK